MTFKLEDNFVNLHLHTEYSLMDSVIQIPNLFHEVEKYNQPAVAITDHGSLAGWYDFQTVAQDSSVKPIFGCEFYCKPNFDKPTDRTRYHLVVLAKNNNGLNRIRKLQNISVREHFYYKPLLPYPLLFENPDDLFVTTACSLGTIGQCFDPTNKKHYPEDAEKFLNKLLDVFGYDNVACEFQFHPDYKAQNIINEKLFELCENVQPKFKIATCDAHFINENDRKKRRQIIADEQNKQLKDINPTLKSNCVGTSEKVLKFAQESDFLYLNEVPKMIEATTQVADLLNSEVELNFGKVIPRFTKHKELKANFMKGHKKVMK